MSGRRLLLITPALLIALAGCTAGGAGGADGGTAAAPQAPPPPPPPAACLLDTAALATTTGLTWAVDEATASDVRCVYDPVGTAAPGATPSRAEDAPADDAGPGPAPDGDAPTADGTAPEGEAADGEAADGADAGAGSGGTEPQAGTDGAAPQADSRDFVSVTVEPTDRDGDPAARLDEIAVLCDDGTRTPLDPATTGFTCTYGGGSAYAVVVRDAQLVVAAASGTPAGTTADQLRTAFAEHLPG